MPEALWRRCSHWCVEMQPKWSATQGSLQGEGGRRGGRDVGIAAVDSVSVCENVHACACVRVCCMWRVARWNIRLTAMIHVYHCSAPHSFLFVPSSWACFHSLWSTAEPCGVLLLTNQTSQCHWAALSKTHGHVSFLHPPAFQCLAGSQAKNSNSLEDSAQPSHSEQRKKIKR